MVDRRRFLTLAGTSTLGMTALSGCLGGGNSDDGNGGGGGNGGGDGGNGGGDGGNSGGGGGGNGDGNGGGDGGSDPTNIGMVYALGGLGDKSFNDMAHTGVKKAKRKLGISYQNAEPQSVSEIETLQRRFARSQNPTYELVVCVGYIQAEPLKKNAKRFPKQNWTVIDTIVEKPNVASYVFKEHQGSFQVGYLAGLLTDEKFNAGAASTNNEKTVGFVGGKKVPLIEKFQAGYTAGVKHAGSNIEVRSAYAGAFNDPAKGKEIALSMYGEGADIVYHAAGLTGIGVFKAAQQAGGYAIGVDSDQSKSAPEYADVIIASMVKHVDRAVFRSVKRTANGNFKGGSTHRLGLSKGGVECVYGQKLGDDIPKPIKQKIEQTKKAIINGKISVPQTMEKV